MQKNKSTHERLLEAYIHLTNIEIRASQNDYNNIKQCEEDIQRAEAELLTIQTIQRDSSRISH